MAATLQRVGGKRLERKIKERRWREMEAEKKQQGLDGVMDETSTKLEKKEKET